VRARCDAAGAAAQLALEAPMACGYGACYGCVVATRDGYKRVCLDGPVFDATELASVTGESDGQ
jgi:NAD(P)H-flavin reductase